MCVILKVAYTIFNLFGKLSEAKREVSSYSTHFESNYQKYFVTLYDAFQTYLGRIVTLFLKRPPTPFRFFL